MHPDFWHSVKLPRQARSECRSLFLSPVHVGNQVYFPTAKRRHKGKPAYLIQRVNGASKTMNSDTTADPG